MILLVRIYILGNVSGWESWVSFFSLQADEFKNPFYAKRFTGDLDFGNCVIPLVCLPLFIIIYGLIFCEASCSIVRVLMKCEKDSVGKDVWVGSQGDSIGA